MAKLTAKAVPKRINIKSSIKSSNAITTINDNNNLDVDYYDNYLNDNESSELFNSLLALDWQDEYIKIFG